MNVSELLLKNTEQEKATNDNSNEKKRKKKYPKCLSLQIIKICNKFSKSLFELLVDETTEWASAFQSSIANIEKLIKSKSNQDRL